MALPFVERKGYVPDLVSAKAMQSIDRPLTLLREVPPVPAG
jgi:hypothetical protein